MTLHIPTLLEEVLDATAAKAGAETRIAVARATLEDEGRRRLADEGAAPSWKSKGGTVRYQEAGEWTASVAVPQEFASYVAERHPEHVLAAVALEAKDLAAALEVLEFAGIKPLRSDLAVREPFQSAFVKGLTIEVAEVVPTASGGVERVFTVTDVNTETGETTVVPGMTGAKAPAKIVVSLDATAKAEAIAKARAAAEQLVAQASVLDDETEPAADPEQVTTLTDRIAAVHADVGKKLATALGLSATGTKVDLARRVALAAFANPSHMTAVVAVVKAAELAPTPTVTLPTAPPVVEREPLDPQDPDLGAKALERAQQLKAEMQERREYAEAHPEAFRHGNAEAIAATEATAAATPADAPMSETPAGGSVTPVEAATPATVPTAASEGPGDTTPSTFGQVLDDPFAEVIAETAAEVADPTPEQVATIDAAESPLPPPADDEADRIAKGFNEAANREKLRQLAKAKGVAPGGTKGDVIGRLVEAGYTAEDLPA